MSHQSKIIPSTPSKFSFQNSLFFVNLAQYKRKQEEEKEKEAKERLKEAKERLEEAQRREKKMENLLQKMQIVFRVVSKKFLNFRILVF